MKAAEPIPSRFSLRIAATLLGVAKGTLWRWRKDGRIEFVHEAGNRHSAGIARSEIEAILRRRVTAADYQAAILKSMGHTPARSQQPAQPNPVEPEPTPQPQLDPVEPQQDVSEPTVKITTIENQSVPKGTPRAALLLFFGDNADAEKLATEVVRKLSRRGCFVLGWSPKELR